MGPMKTQMREVREAYGFTIFGLAEAAGVSASSISLIERGLVLRPKSETRRALCHALMAQEDFLFPGGKTTTSTPDPEIACNFCGRKKRSSRMLRIRNSKRYRKRGWCSDRCLRRDIETDSD